MTQEERRCSYCTAPLKGATGQVVKCEYCGLENFILAWPGEIQDMLSKAESARKEHRYNSALKIYDEILRKDPRCTDALWCRLLTDYGIEMVNETPTLKRLSSKPITEHKNYIELQNICNGEQAEVYSKTAKKIEEIRKKAAEVAAKQIPCDVFICFKHKGDGGNITDDYILGREIYDVFFNFGKSVFFSPKSLADMPGEEYEPLIYHALSTAKVMILLGTKIDYVNAVWLENEWARFLDIINEDRRKVLIPCISEEIGYLLPSELKGLQYLAKEDFNFKERLIKTVNEVLSRFADENKSNRKRKEIRDQEFKKATDIGQQLEKRVREGRAVTEAVPASEGAKLKQAKMLFDNKNYKKADKMYSEILASNSQSANAWWGRAKCASRMTSGTDLILTDAGADFFDKAISFTADDAIGDFIKDAIRAIKLSGSPLAAQKLFAYGGEVISEEQKADLSQHLFSVAMAGISAGGR